jgi:hypothetical protein
MFNNDTEGLHYGLGDVPEVAGLVVGLQEGGRHLSARVRGVEVVSLLHAPDIQNCAGNKKARYIKKRGKYKKRGKNCAELEFTKVNLT